MQKLSNPLAHEISPTKRGSRVLRIASILVLGIGLAALIQETAAICHGQWCQLLGSDAEVRTPILDSVQEGVQTAHSSFWNAISPYFQSLPWSPSVVLPVAVVVVVVGMVMLKF
jgi:hypothetical protein